MTDAVTDDYQIDDFWRRLDEEFASIVVVADEVSAAEQECLLRLLECVRRWVEEGPPP